MALVLEDRFLPATLSMAPMSDEAFRTFCEEHPDLRFETTADGELIVMPPPCSFGGAQETEIAVQLGSWARRNGKGIATHSNTSFVLSNGSRRIPDAAWTLKSEFQKHHADRRQTFWHLPPTFVIELRSESDRMRALRAKMREYVDNGTELGWLIDPQTQAGEIFRPRREVERVENPTSVAGEGSVEGFVLDLRAVWDPFE